MSKLRTGHTSAPEGDRHIVHPCLNGSVLEALIRIWMLGRRYDTSSKHSVVSGSNFCIWGETYSDDLRKPKKAVVTAAQSMILSACASDVDARK